MPSQLVGANYGWLYQKSLQDTLQSMATHGFRGFELTPLPPHMPSPPYGIFERRALKRQLDRFQLKCISVNPSYTDLNLISTNTEFRELTYRQLVHNMELAHDLESPLLIVIPGRRNALTPTPDEDAVPVLLEQLSRLLRHADRLGITISMENSPYGFIQTADEMLSIAGAVNHPRFKLTYDSANGFMNEDPAVGLAAVAGQLGLVHISDTWKNRWAHTQIGKGEIDFDAFARTLQHSGYAGLTVYELVDGIDPDPRLPGDIKLLSGYGWSV